MKMRLFFRAIVLTAFLPGFVAAADKTANANKAQETVEDTITFAQMGRSEGVLFVSGQSEAGIDFTMPEDKIVTDAELHLDIKATSDQITDDTMLEVRANGVFLGELALKKALDGKASYQVNLPAMLVTTSNALNFRLSDRDELICSPEQIGISQLNILPTSYVKAKSQLLNFPADLSFFPRPFWDPLDLTKGSVTVSLPETPNTGQISAASLLASWFGTVTDKRGVSFEVLTGDLPSGNGIVIAAPGDEIGGLEIADSEEPYLQVIPNPFNSASKLLLIVGKDRKDLRKATWRLTQGDFETQAVQHIVKEAGSIPKSKAYDAPRWLSTEEPIYLHQLMAKDERMVSTGFWHKAIDIKFRTAPDLYLWDAKSFPLNISYRFPTKSWIDEDRSSLGVTLNGEFLKALPVNEQGLIETIWSKLGGDARKEEALIPVQPRDVYGDNQLSLYFNIVNQPGISCDELMNSDIKSSIETDSRIDMSKASHFALMPELSYFVGASFPFSKFADYSKTAVLLPEVPGSTHLETLLDLGARSGAATGTLVSRENIFLGIPKTRSSLEGRDVLAISTMADDDFNEEIFEQSPYMASDRDVLELRNLSLIQKVTNWILSDWELDHLDAERYFSSQTAWRGFVSYPSPWSSGRMVVVATGSDSDQLSRLESDLRIRKINENIHGNASIITDLDGVRSFYISPQRPTGEYSWYKLVLWYGGKHIILLALVAGLISLILAFPLHGAYKNRVKRRLNAER
ncbi:cellulose biosynthesis cyclic di-GMP-binding regulatory protein BcsB [Vibrio sp. JC009]|uniref:cellulose biosynthesis cyclic di-GMP-binding regulatory protein BcsB n=1 Tax=Vibrio sp. JC009 TaxID=2912314 RepID=UPI0023B01697|nr:cellulose biosynthesis cyclic di-GMP-binding regulatory protein BcsB [Vibrio sp. JC009]WED20652.1 cellulose biosynthesis cyclic di-GMP-binding regulatory protein BcsB [Vibrio sp. JC009]